MSHIVRIETQVRDIVALGAACRRLSLAEPVRETVKLFSDVATGYCVRLTDWRYPVVFDVETGQVSYDNYGGRWGEQRELDRLMQAYAVEKAKVEAQRQGYTVTEHALHDGSIKMTVNVGGAA